MTVVVKDAGLRPREGVTFSLQFRDPHEPHTTADATVDTSVVYSAVTDVQGRAALSVNATPDYTLGSGVYVVKVGGFLASEVEIDAGGNLRDLLA